MLPKRYRLTRDQEIRETLRAKQYTGSTTLLSFTAKDNSLPNPRLVVITKRALGNAVIRNRVRRRIMDAYSKIMHKISKNVDLVLFPKVGIIDQSNNSLLNGLEVLFIRIGII